MSEVFVEITYFVQFSLNLRACQVVEYLSMHNCVIQSVDGEMGLPQ